MFVKWKVAFNGNTLSAHMGSIIKWYKSGLLPALAVTKYLV